MIKGRLAVLGPVPHRGDGERGHVADRALGRLGEVGVEPLVRGLDGLPQADLVGGQHAAQLDLQLFLRGLVREVHVAGPLLRYIAQLVRKSDPADPDCAPSARRLLRYGAGVRGGQALVLASKVHALMKGRDHVAFSDLARVTKPALRHRLIPSFEAEADGVDTDTILERLLEETPRASDAVEALAG